MNGKSFSIPVGMVFKRHYCVCCGTKLKKEKTHRVVSKDDVDYYQYHDYGTFPRVNYDVYGYQYKCPNCMNRTSYGDQVIYSKIQRKYKKKILSKKEIRDNYQEYKKIKDKEHLITGLVIFTLFFILFYILMRLFGNQSQEDMLITSILLILFWIFTMVSMIRSFYGKRKFKKHRDYSYADEKLYERLHALGSNNKQYLNVYSKCYCYHCKQEIEPTEITEFIENTCVCPKCGVDSILVETDDVHITFDILDGMNKYWF